MRGKGMLKVNGILQIIKGAVELGYGGSILFLGLFAGLLLSAFTPHNLYASYSIFMIMCVCFTVGGIMQLIAGVFCTVYSGTKEKAKLCIGIEIAALCMQLPVTIYLTYLIAQSNIVYSDSSQLTLIIFIGQWLYGGIAMCILTIIGANKNLSSPDYESDTFKRQQYFPNNYVRPQWTPNGMLINPYYNNYTQYNPQGQYYQPYNNPNGYNNYSNPPYQNNQPYPPQNNQQNPYNQNYQNNQWR